MSYLEVAVTNQETGETNTIPINRALQAIAVNQKFIFDAISNLELECPMGDQEE